MKLKGMRYLGEKQRWKKKLKIILQEKSLGFSVGSPGSSNV